MDRSADLTTPKMTNVFIGWPVANGGTDTTGKPHKIYVRWWAKEYFPMAEWRSIAYSSIVGTPIGGEVDAQGVYQLGELVRIESGTNTDYIYGILSSATSGRVELTTGYMFEMPPPFSDHRYASIQAAELSNAVIRGMTSGAVIQLPNIADQVGPSSSKILRMWDNVDGRNWRTSWSTNSTIIGGSNLQSNLDYPFYTTAPRYRLHEFYVDAVDSSNVTSQSFVDGISGMSSDPFTGSQTVHYDAARGFSIALLGVDSNVDTDRTNGSFCEIYQDSTPQRVVFAAESTWAARTSDEIQRTTEWSPTSITVEINQGAFDSLHGKYMYVVDSNNQPINTTGILL
ncbi:MAG: hypothetical protein GXP55_08410 [Deltaproteobacteria bacterium]|nr:hypothetical protein [Deltaproteobacteria bacterium]